MNWTIHVCFKRRLSSFLYIFPDHFQETIVKLAVFYFKKYISEHYFSYFVKKI